jgi:hypothetical protein
VISSIAAELYPRALSDRETRVGRLARIMSRIAPVPAAASTSDRRRLEKASVGDWIGDVDELLRSFGHAGRAKRTPILIESVNALS